MKVIKSFTKGLSFVSAFAMLFCAAQQSFAGTGTDHGYFWSLYSSGGTASITFPDAGTYAGNYEITWANCNDVIGGKGWSTGSAQTIGFNIGSLRGTYKNVRV